MENNERFIKIKNLLIKSLDQESYDLETINNSIKDDTDLLGEIRIDSLNYLEFFMRLEDVFQIQISENDYGELTTIGKISNYVQQKQLL